MHLSELLNAKAYLQAVGDTAQYWAQRTQDSLMVMDKHQAELWLMIEDAHERLLRAFHRPITTTEPNARVVVGLLESWHEAVHTHHDFTLDQGSPSLWGP
jgi:hypothetical protein